MKVRYTDGGNPLAFQRDKEYEVISTECGWYRIRDESGDDYLYSPAIFEVTEALPIPPETEPSPMPRDMLA